MQQEEGEGGIFCFGRWVVYVSVCICMPMRWLFLLLALGKRAGGFFPFFFLVGLSSCLSFLGVQLLFCVCAWMGEFNIISQ